MAGPKRKPGTTKTGPLRQLSLRGCRSLAGLLPERGSALTTSTDLSNCGVVSLVVSSCLFGEGVRVPPVNAKKVRPPYVRLGWVLTALMIGPFHPGGVARTVLDRPMRRLGCRPSARFYAMRKPGFAARQLGPVRLCLARQAQAEASATDLP
jgi:hypothetical protein